MNDYEETERALLCPVMTRPGLTEGRSSCVREACAWYVGGRCAVAVLADRLGEEGGGHGQA